MSQPTIYLPNKPVPELDGVSAGMMRGDDGTQYCLVIPNDPAAHLTDLEWGAYGTEVKGADSTWDGLTNTLALLAGGSDHPAAEAIAFLNKPGDENPLYLPSQRELALCWATVPHLFEKTLYWSSTQYSAHLAWYQYFDNGHQDIGSKNNAGRVRAVRRLIIQ